MADDGDEAVWRARLRWRRRGAWRAPAFGALTVADAILLGPLPIAGQGTGFVPGLLLAAFFNLVALAVVAPLVSRALRRRRPDLPDVVADDRAGTALIVLVTLGLLAGGLAHRPGRLAHDDAFSAQSQAVRRYVAHNEPGYAARIAEADTVEQGDDLWRTCVPGDPPLCLLVSTAQSPPGITVDADRRPNAIR